MPKSVRINILGMRFGNLTVTSYFGQNAKGEALWNCKCECGKDLVCRSINLRKGKTKSCVTCSRKLSEKVVRRNRAPDQNSKSKMPEYKIWQGMKRRCNNKNASDFDRYGGRGVKVCKRWNDSFDAFIQDLGRRPSEIHQIDRYPNKLGDYEPGNCRWATPKENARNTTSAREITLEGKTMRLTDWASFLGMNPGNFSTLYKRWGDSSLERLRSKGKLK